MGAGESFLPPIAATAPAPFGVLLQKVKIQLPGCCQLEQPNRLSLMRTTLYVPSPPSIPDPYSTHDLMLPTGEAVTVGRWPSGRRWTATMWYFCKFHAWPAHQAKQEHTTGMWRR